MMSHAEEAPRRRSDTKHAAIIRSAVDLAKTGGYAETTIERIAAHAGVGKATIYRWWESKADLFVEVYKSLVPAYKMEKGSEDPRGEMLRLLRSVFSHYRQTPAGEILTGLISDSQLHATARQALKEDLVAGRKPLLVNIIDAAKEKRILPVGTDTVLIADAITGLIWRYLLVEPEKLDDAMAGRMVDQLVFGGVS